MNETFDVFEISKFEKELLELYIKYEWGNFKMYDMMVFPLSTHCNDDTALLTIQEFYDKSHLVQEEDFSWD